MSPEVTEFFSRFTTLDTALWVVGWGGLAILLAPILVTATGFRLLRHTVDENPTLAEPDGSDPEYEELYAALTALGFRPAGMVTEQMTLFHDEWFTHIPVRVLASKDGMTYAALYRLRPGALLRVAFDTFVTGDRLVRTAMPGAGVGGMEPTYRRVEMPWQPPAMLLAGHREEVAAFVAKHGGAPVAVSLMDRSAFDVRIETKQLRAMGNGFVWLYPVIGWTAPFFVSLVLMSWADACPVQRSIGWAAVAAGLVYRWFAWSVMPLVHNFAERCEPIPDDEAV